MKVIDDLYTPDVALLCIGGFYTMGSKEASYAVNNVFCKCIDFHFQFLSHCKIAIPMHYKTFGILSDNAEEFKKDITRDDVHVEELEPGKVFKL